MRGEKMMAGASLGGLAGYADRFRPARESSREYLVLEIDQIKLNLRHAELRLKEHDEQEAYRKEQAEQLAKGFGPNASNNLNSQIGGDAQAWEADLAR